MDKRKREGGEDFQPVKYIRSFSIIYFSLPQIKRVGQYRMENEFSSGGNERLVKLLYRDLLKSL